jgi:hypothetical protein
MAQSVKDALPLSPTPSGTTGTAPTPPRPVKPLAQGRRRVLHSSEAQYGSTHGAVLPAGTPFSDALSGEFWLNHAQELRPNDEIKVFCDDGKYTGVLLVRAVAGGGGVKSHVSVAQLSYIAFDDLPASASARPEYKVEHRGAHLQWCVIRIADDKAVVEHLDSEEAAGNQLKAFAKGLARRAA